MSDEHYCRRFGVGWSLGCADVCALLAVTGLVAACQPGASTADLDVRLDAVAELVGPDGGSVPGPNGAALTVPAGALLRSDRLRIDLPPVGSTAALPPGLAPIGPTYAMRPAGIYFLRPVTVAIPFDRAQVPPRVGPRLLASLGAKRGWIELTDALANGATMVAAVRESASFIVVVPVVPDT